MRKRRNFVQLLSSKSYERKPFENPYFQERKIKTRKERRLLLISLLVAIAAVPVILLFSPLYRISAVYIDGLTTIQPSDVETRIREVLDTKILGVIPRRQRPFVSEDAIRSVLNDYDFAELSVELKKRSITVTAEERISQLVLKTRNVFSLVDLHGEFIREANEQEVAAIEARINVVNLPELQTMLQPTMPIILFEQEDDAQTRALAAYEPETILQFDELLREMNVAPVYYVLENENEPWMRIHTNNGYELLFDTNQDPEGQIEVLKVFLKEKKDELGTINRIDIRFGNNVYIR